VLTWYAGNLSSQNNYLKKAKDFFEDGHPQTGVAVLMELTKFTVPTDPGSLRCCVYDEAMNHLFNFWKVRSKARAGVLMGFWSSLGIPEWRLRTSLQSCKLHKKQVWNL